MTKRHLEAVPVYRTPDLHELHLTDRELLALRDALAGAVLGGDQSPEVLGLYARVVALLAGSK